MRFSYLAVSRSLTSDTLNSHCYLRGCKNVNRLMLLEIAMLQATGLSSTTTPVGTFHPPVKTGRGATPMSKRVNLTFQAVEFEGVDIYHQSDESAVSHLAEALRLAETRGKSELKINNITPWIKVGEDETGQVPIIQNEIERKLAIACKKLRHNIPECRLDLHRGEFAIRCYLGRMKPSDHIYEEDLMSDSR